MRPDLKIHQGDESPHKPTLRIRPYIGVYVVRFCKGDPASVWDGDEKPIATFEHDEAEEALDFAENLSRDPVRFGSVHHTVNHADGLVVNDHTGKELGRFVLAWTKPAPV